MRKINSTELLWLLFSISSYPAVGQSVDVVDCSKPPLASGWQRTRYIYYCPLKYPDFTMISMHRGYSKDGPENSVNAVNGAIALTKTDADGPRVC